MLSYKMKRIEERWGLPFWSLVAQFADQGLSRRAVALALGYAPNWFTRLLADNPDRDPFEAYGNVAAYIKDTGESFESALLRMASQGFHLLRAAKEFGYTRTDHLRKAMRLRGISVEFSPCPRVARCSVIQRFESESQRSALSVIRELRGAGYSWTHTAHQLGYGRGRSVKLALASMGVDPQTLSREDK